VNDGKYIVALRINRAGDGTQRVVITKAFSHAGTTIIIK